MPSATFSRHFIAQRPPVVAVIKLSIKMDAFVALSSAVMLAGKVWGIYGKILVRCCPPLQPVISLNNRHHTFFKLFFFSTLQHNKHWRCAINTEMSR